MEPRLPPAIAFGDVIFESVSGELQLDGQTQRLRPQTAAVLAQLLISAGKLVSRDDLSKAVWGDVLVTENSVTQCIAEIRRALGPEREPWLKTNARRGYRLDAPPATFSLGNPAEVNSPAIPEAPAALAPTTSAATPVPLVPRRPPGMAWVAVAAALVLLLAAWWGWRSLRFGPVGQVSLAVLPFEVVGASTESTWFAEVVGEDITFNLARIPGARVVSRVSTQAYPARGADLRRVGAELDVRYVVAGSVERDGERVTLRMQLIDVATGAMRWGERLDSTLTALHEAERDVANRVANALHTKLVDEEAARVRRADPSNPMADDLALQAWAAWNRGTPADVTRARELALRALELNDRSVIAWKTMASWHLRARINQSLPAEQAEAGAEHAANRALAIDPDHPLVHTVWGAAQVLRGRYAEGQQALEHEIRTNPSHPVAYSYLGIAHLMLGQRTYTVISGTWYVGYGDTYDTPSSRPSHRAASTPSRPTSPTSPWPRTKPSLCNQWQRTDRPGVIRQTGPMQRLVFGEFDGRRSARAEAFLAACLAGGIKAELSDAIDREIWEKYVFLVGLSGTTTTMRTTIGPIRAHPQTRAFLNDVMREVVAVGRAHGVALAADQADRAMQRADTVAYEMTSSLHHDLERGNRLEVRWLSGGVVELGQARNVPTPLNRAIADILALRAGGSGA